MSIQHLDGAPAKVDRYKYFIDFGKNVDGGGGSNCTVSYIYIGFGEYSAS